MVMMSNLQEKGRGQRHCLTNPDVHICTVQGMTI